VRKPIGETLYFLGGNTVFWGRVGMVVSADIQTDVKAGMDLKVVLFGSGGD